MNIVNFQHLFVVFHCIGIFHVVLVFVRTKVGINRIADFVEKSNFLCWRGLLNGDYLITWSQLPDIHAFAILLSIGTVHEDIDMERSSLQLRGQLHFDIPFRPFATVRISSRYAYFWAVYHQHYLVAGTGYRVIRTWEIYLQFLLAMHHIANL